MPAFARLFDRKPQYEVINPAQHLDALAAEYSGHHVNAKGAPAAAAARRKDAAPLNKRLRGPALNLKAVQNIASRVKAAVAEGLTPRSAIARGALARAQMIRAATNRPAIFGATPPLRAAVAVLAVMALTVALALASPSLFVGTPFAKAASSGFVVNSLMNAGRAAIRNPGQLVQGAKWGNANAAGTLNRVWHLGLHQPAWAPSRRTLGLAWSAAQPLIALALFGILTRAAVATRRAPAARNAALAAIGAVLLMECVWGVFHRALHSPAAALAHSAIFAIATIAAAAQAFRAFKASGVALLPVAAFACAELARHIAIVRMN